MRRSRHGVIVKHPRNVRHSCFCLVGLRLPWLFQRVVSVRRDRGGRGAAASELGRPDPHASALTAE